MYNLYYYQSRETKDIDTFSKISKIITTAVLNSRIRIKWIIKTYKGDTKYRETKEIELGVQRIL